MKDVFLFSFSILTFFFSLKWCLDFATFCFWFSDLLSKHTHCYAFLLLTRCIVLILLLGLIHWMSLTAIRFRSFPQRFVTSDFMIQLYIVFVSGGAIIYRSALASFFIGPVIPVQPNFGFFNDNSFTFFWSARLVMFFSYYNRFLFPIKLLWYEQLLGMIYFCMNFQGVSSPSFL